MSCDLKTLEQLSYKVVEASPDAMIVINEHGKIIIFNTHAELMFGYSRESVINNSVEMLLMDDRRELHVAHRTKFFTNPGIREMGNGAPLFAKHRNGSAFQVEIKLAYLIVTAGVHALAVVRRIGNNVLVSNKES